MKHTFMPVCREANIADVPALARIRSLDWGDEEYWKVRISDYLACKTSPRLALKPRVIYVALEGDSLRGFIAGHLTRRYACQGELQWIDVMPERRRAGVASQLLRHLADWFVQRNALRICVDVDPANIAARQFYTRLGAGILKPHWMVWKDISAVLGQAP